MVVLISQHSSWLMTKLLLLGIEAPIDEPIPLQGYIHVLRGMLRDA